MCPDFSPTILCLLNMELENFTFAGNLTTLTIMLPPETPGENDIRIKRIIL